MEKLKAFTLVELSIVIIIVGLIISGVVAGSSLIDSFGLKRVLVSIDKFKKARFDYRLKYDAVPGDHNIAFSYWGTDCAATADDCNGDGSGDLNSSGNSEYQIYWKHLILSKILPGNYTGSRTGPANKILVGIDIPEVGFRDAGADVGFDSYWGVLPQNSDFMTFAREVDASNPYAAFLKPREAQSIDIKIDDGLPVNGYLFSGTPSVGSTGTCTNGSGGETVINATAYTLTNDEIACRIIVSFDLNK